MGHHPIFAGTTKTESERIDLQERLLPILENYEVDAYYCGHIHNFQHINTKGSSIDYFVNSSASQSREVVPFDGTVFKSSATDFAMCSLNDSESVTTFIDKTGKIIYQHKRKSLCRAHTQTPDRSDTRNDRVRSEKGNRRQGIPWPG